MPPPVAGIHRAKRHHTTKRNFEIFNATEFLAAAIDVVPPKSKHTVRYCGCHRNKRFLSSKKMCNKNICLNFHAFSGSKKYDNLASKFQSTLIAN